MQIQIDVPEHLHDNAEHVRHLVQGLVNRLTLDANISGRPTQNAQRDDHIYAQHKAGKTYAELARDFKLSTVRIAQIIAHRRATMTQGEAAV